MKKLLFSLMGGAVFCLSLVFSSCGNIDNPLEEIGNSNPKVAALAGALDEGAEVTFNFTMHAEAYIQFLKKLDDNDIIDIPEESLPPYWETGSMPIKVIFKKKSGKYEFELAKAYVDGDEISEQDYEYYSRLFALEYVSKNNQLKVSLVGANDVDDNAGDEEGGGNNGTRALVEYSTGIPLSTIIFDINDDAYSQYVYPFTSYVLLESIEINGKDKTNLLKNKYPTKASFYRHFVYENNATEAPSTRGTRTDASEDAPEQKESFCVFYNAGETWADVNKRYKNEAGTALLDEPGDDGFAYLDSYIDNIPGMSFYYNEEYVNEENLTQVKYSEKVGYKGATAYPDGYLMVSHISNIILNN